MSNTAQHIEWRSLIEISGPFLAASVLESAFPQGLDAVETPRRQKLRAAYEEWRDAVNEEDPLLPQLHQEWIRLVLTDLLEYDNESLVSAADWAGELPSVSSQENTGTFSPDWLIHAPGDKKARLFISIFPPDTNLESSGQNDGWPASLLERMTLLCRAHGVRLGLLSNGERWMLVNAPEGSTSGQASWYARLWFQEPLTLKAFRSLLGVRRCFGPAETTLEALLEESLKHQEEVTDTLGAQVRRAVEVLIQCLDKADEDRNRELLRDVSPAELYEAGLTVMMRLVFILCAEERGLLLSGDPLYDQCYAVSTLRGQLSGETPEILDRRHDAWARLLAIFRGVYGGIEHQDLRLPALGGSLFDPDRFPFLEGRAKGTRWRDVPASPLPIDNRTVLLLLNSLQILEQSTGALLLSYRALDVEQIGHVYEGLLEHTVVRVPKVTLGLKGTQSAKDPNIPLAELESVSLDGAADLVKRIREVTGRSESAIKNDLKKVADEHLFSKVIGVCGSDMELAERIRPFTNLLRTDAWEDPIIYRANSFMVTLGADRRETGTHYTPKSLTESIVSTTLEPIVYSGPSEGKPQDEWLLKTPQEILDLKVCDPAMGSGAFLVQACRYLGERLVEAWLHAEENGKKVTIDGETCDHLEGAEPMPPLKDERLTIAKRLVAERCLYGVDINPLAVELAKLSIWLVTLAKGRPFGFLDHNLRSGDSLLGIHKVEQLTQIQLNPELREYQLSVFSQNIERAIHQAINLRHQLRSVPIRDIHDVESMSRLDADARGELEIPKIIANALIAELFVPGINRVGLEKALSSLAVRAGQAISGDTSALNAIIEHTQINLFSNSATGITNSRFFHWPLEFPEVFQKSTSGFNAVFGNPPFMGGRRISSAFGSAYEKVIKQSILGNAKGSVNLVLYFILRGIRCLNENSSAGFLATDSITENETREVGLTQVFKEAFPYCAQSSFPWPGEAGVYVSILHLWKGIWSSKKTLDGKHVTSINTMLESGEELPTPYRLKLNEPFCSDGIKVQGIGFVLTTQEALQIIANEPNSQEVITRYVVGDDINNEPNHIGKRWVINFWTRNEHESQKYITPWNIVVEKVKPYRDSLTKQVHEDCFWKFWDRREAFFNKIRSKGRALVSSKLSKHFSVVFGNPQFIYSEKAKVFDFQSYSAFSILQSTLHSWWALVWGSTTGETPAYVGSACFDTFPFPDIFASNGILDSTLELDTLKDIGERYYAHRDEVIKKSGRGLTVVYNKFHLASEMAQEIKILRDIHVEMDNAVLSVYGWDDIKTDHHFFKTRYGDRFTLSEAKRTEILHRLIALNARMHKNEIAQSVHRK